MFNVELNSLIVLKQTKKKKKQASTIGVIAIMLFLFTYGIPENILFIQGY